MNAQALTFNKADYDPFIDFLKAYSIICVVVAHILPADLYKYILFQVWGDMQVPQFVLIQVFHAYKKGVQPKLNWSSILKRICLPFVAVQAAIIACKGLVGGDISWTSLLISGGFGPGSYYIWIYLQIAVLLVLMWPWLRKLSLLQSVIVFLIISIGFEVLFSIVDCPDWLYRLLCVRYLFLIPLGLIWVEKGVSENWSNTLLSVISIVAVLFFVFTDYDLEPFFFNTGWETHRWICYFYIPFLLTYGLYMVWDRVKNIKYVQDMSKWTAARSYEIFLAQMGVFACFSSSFLAFIPNAMARFTVWAIVVFTLSIVLGGLLYSFRKSVLKW